MQTQVLPYLRELGKNGIEVSLLTFEPDRQKSWPLDEREKWETALDEQGIEWHSLPYHKRPSVPATLYDIIIGAVVTAMISREKGVRVLHARAHISMAMALIARMIVKGKVIFDFRGLVADEYVDAGIWDEGGLVYRGFKLFERYALRMADQVVVLTERMKMHLIESGLACSERIEVIPCCTDFSRFDILPQKTEDRAHTVDRFTVVYAGSVTGLYLLKEMGRFFLALRKRRGDAFLHVLTSSNHRWARAELLDAGLNEKDFEIIAISPAEIPRYLVSADVGLSFRKATFSQTAASPTKVPEYLAAGIPVVSTAGVGDIDELIQSHHIGVLLDIFDETKVDQAIEKLEQLLADPTLPERCRNVAIRHFDLGGVGVARYLSVYYRLKEELGNPPSAGNKPTELPESTDIQFFKEG